MSGQLMLNGRFLDIGKGKDALYQFAAEEEIVFSLSYDEGEELLWVLSYDPDGDVLLSNRGIHLGEGGPPRLLTNFQYLPADRIGPQTIYDTSASTLSAKELGTKGEYTVHFLHANGNSFKIKPALKHHATEDLGLMSQLNGWMGEISPGVRVSTLEVPQVDKMLLNYQFALKRGRTASFKPINVGFGISYVLPVVVSLLTTDQDKIIIIENPESHIHPRGQSELGKLIALSAASGAQLFVETHSDHIVNGIRVAVKNGLIDKDAVNISYFTKVTTTDDEQYSEITDIRVDDQGELSDYPKDFMDEWNNQLLKLI
jgi:predicted ATPase